MKFILGKKIEMTQIFEEDGTVVPVTQVQAGPCTVTQVKLKDGKDGYSAVQVGFGKKKKLSKALKGHLKDLEDFRYLREFNLNSKDEIGELTRGDKISVDTFEAGDAIKVIGTSKGRGFQGVVKRHSFHGSPASHGHKDQLRAPGSIGPTEPARVFPGMRMAGHMGDQQVTIKNLKVAKVDLENNILYIKGAVPGARNGLLMLSGQGELKVNTASPASPASSVNSVNSDTQEQTNTIETPPASTGASLAESKRASQGGHQENSDTQQETDIQNQKDTSQTVDEASKDQVTQEKTNATQTIQSADNASQEQEAPTTQDQSKEDKKPTDQK